MSIGEDGLVAFIEVGEVPIEPISRGKVVEIKKPFDISKRALDEITSHPSKTIKGKVAISLKKASLKLVSGRHKKVPLRLAIDSQKRGQDINKFPLATDSFGAPMGPKLEA